MEFLYDKIFYNLFCFVIAFGEIIWNYNISKIRMLQEEYSEEIESIQLENGKALQKRSITGRKFTGKSCEYIKLESISSISGCVDGKSILKSFWLSILFLSITRNKVCDISRSWSKKTVLGSQWWSCVGIYQERWQVCWMSILYRGHQ